MHASPKWPHPQNQGPSSLAQANPTPLLYTRSPPRFKKAVCRSNFPSEKSLVNTAIRPTLNLQQPPKSRRSLSTKPTSWLFPALRCKSREFPSFEPSSIRPYSTAERERGGESLEEGNLEIDGFLKTLEEASWAKLKNWEQWLTCLCLQLQAEKVRR